MHVCVCLYSPVCVWECRSLTTTKEGSRSTTMDRFPAIFFSSKLNDSQYCKPWLRAEPCEALLEPVSFHFTILLEMHCPRDSIPSLCFNCLFSNHTSLTFTVIILEVPPFCVSHLSFILDDFFRGQFFCWFSSLPFPLEVSVTVYHLLYFRWDRGYLPWCVCQHQDSVTILNSGEDKSAEDILVLLDVRQRLLLDHQWKLPPKLFWYILRGFAEWKDQSEKFPVTKLIDLVEAS